MIKRGIFTGNATPPPEKKYNNKKNYWSNLFGANDIPPKKSLANSNTSSGLRSNTNCKKSANNACSSGCLLI